MSRIYWDTMLFVYLLENNREYASQVQQIHARMVDRGDRLITSSFTLGEILVAPFKTGDAELTGAVKSFFRSSDLEMVQFDAQTAEAYAEIRATSGVRPADAIHLACASIAKADLFISNDKSLQRITVPGIQFVAGLEVAGTLLGVEG